ncbi:YitT family protein [Desulfobulbus sp. US5]|nr:YitT family protein [Desulfobulbus sp. US4]MCW5214275.1 YitT family protein [Desulfobulbus sp. US5]WLE98217.1 MAG: YitT family protein [Candidatus Electrothrix communis]
MRTDGNPQALFLSPWQVIRDIGLLCLGGILCAVGVNSILIPHNFVTGGITGVALIVYKIFPSLDPGMIYLLLNLPLFALAWMVVGRRFFVYSILGTVALSVSLLFFHFDLHIEDRMLNALLAGVILGVGAGLCLKTSGSQGGTDMLSVVLLKRFSIKIGNTLMVLNGLVLLLISVYYSIEAVLYTMIVVVVSSKVINLVVVGLSQRKAVFIISRHWDDISREILKDIRRGVTIIKGEGGYSRKEEKILYTVVQLTEIGTLKRLVHGIDPDAFVVISDTQEVINYRIGNQPHW